MRGRRREVREVESSRRVEAWSAVADRVGAATNQHRPKADRREGGCGSPGRRRIDVGWWLPDKISIGSMQDRHGMPAAQWD
jgi:hypothetical protein